MRSSARYAYALLCFLLLCTVAQAQHFVYHTDYEKVLRRTRNPKDDLYYPALLPRFLNNDTTITISQMLGLLVGYTGQAGFMPYEDLKTEKVIYQLNNKGKYEEVLEICDTFLRQHPLNQLAIIEKAYAFYKMNRTDSADYYKAQFASIMAAMDWSGDGHTPDHAIFAIGPQDGQNFIDKYYHADLGRSAPSEDSHGNFCDGLEMKFKKNGKLLSTMLYFSIQHAVNTTAAAATEGNVPVKQ